MCVWSTGDQRPWEPPPRFCLVVGRLLGRAQSMTRPPHLSIAGNAARPIVRELVARIPAQVSLQARTRALLHGDRSSCLGHWTVSNGSQLTVAITSTGGDEQDRQPCECQAPCGPVPASRRWVLGTRASLDLGATDRQIAVRGHRIIAFLCPRMRLVHPILPQVRRTSSRSGIAPSFWATRCRPRPKWPASRCGSPAPCSSTTDALRVCNRCYRLLWRFGSPRST